jgi:hypothetical protein
MGKTERTYYAYLPQASFQLVECVWSKGNAEHRKPIKLMKAIFFKIGKQIRSTELLCNQLQLRFYLTAEFSLFSRV